jgi:DNA-binding beta-propeller fold protein YncE
LTERSAFQKFSGTLSVAALSSLMLLLAACAAAPQQVVQEEKDYVWPGPPAQPVMRWERQFRTEKEFTSEEKSSGWKDVLLGEEDEDERYVYLQTPYGVHADDFGRVLVADPAIVGIAVFDFNLNRFFTAGDEGEGRFAGALGVASDSEGNIYATSGRDAMVYVFDRSGNFVRSIGGNDEFGRPVGIAVDDKRGRIYVTDTLKHHIAVFDLAGQPLMTIGERGEEAGQFNFPLNVTLSDDGRLFVVDSMNFRVQILEPDGEPVRTISRQGDRVGELSRPRGIALDSKGHIYVSDAAFNNVQIFDQQGRHMMVFGAGGAGPGGFQFPSGMAFDAEDRLYVVDQLNKRVQVFRFLGVPDIEASENIDSSP